MKKLVLALLLAIECSVNATSFTFTNPDSQLIPDNSFDGSTYTISVSGSPIISLTDLRVHLDIQGDFNGDLLAFLSFSGDDTKVSFLLNGVGLGTSDHADLGFADRGMSVWLDDGAVTDIHLADGHGSTLTGTYQPDGRDLTSLLGLASVGDLRPYKLDQFAGLNPNGDWTLALFDLSEGGTSTLLDWQLDITGTENTNSVPDSISSAGSISMIGLLLFHWAGQRKKRNAGNIP